MKRVTVFDEMNRLFEEMRHMISEGRGVGYGTQIPVRMETDDDGYVVHADLPGFETGEIDLQFDDGTLSIDARHDGSADGEAWTRRVHEELRLSGNIDLDGIEASYHNGVLEVRLPAEDATETAGHRINIE